MSIDTVIAEQMNNGAQYAAHADQLLSAAMSASGNYQQVGGYVIAWQPTAVNTVTTTQQDISAIYEPPTNAPPPFDRNSFQQLSPVDPYTRTPIYQMVTAGLFSETAPSITTEDFTTAAPVIDYSAVDAQLATIALPALNEYAPIAISRLQAGQAAKINLPSYAVATNAVDPGAMANPDSRFAVEFDRVSPEMRAFIESGVNAWEQRYSPQNAAAQSQLETRLQDILNRGSGLPADYEAALYRRDQSRIENDHKRVCREIEDGPRRRGFSYPPQHTLTAALVMAQQAAADNLSVASTATAINIYEKELGIIQFALQLSATLRQANMQAYLQYSATMAQVNQQADEHAFRFANYAIGTYEALLKRYAAQSEMMRTETTLIDTQLKLSLAGIDVAKLDLEYLNAQSTIDAQQVHSRYEQIQSELARVTILADLRKAILLEADYESAKVETYGKEVSAYVSKYGINKLKNEVFLGALSGDTAKMNAEMAKLDASVKESDIELRRLQGDVSVQALRGDNNKMLVELYQAEMAGYKANIDASTTVFDTSIRGQIARTEAYKANKSTEIDILKARMEQDQQTLSKAIEQSRIAISTADINARAYAGHVQLQSTLGAHIGAVYANAAASTLGSQNTMYSDVISHSA